LLRQMYVTFVIFLRRPLGQKDHTPRKSLYNLHFLVLQRCGLWASGSSVCMTNSFKL
jgi:hypothetical protein